MYMNLKAEMARKGITNEQLANGIGINPATMSAKLNIAGRMRLDEAQCLRDKFFPGILWESYMRDLNVKYGYDGQQNKNRPGGLPMRIDTFTPHQLRHTFCTLMYFAGVDVMTARDQMGHKDISVTLGIYTALDKKFKKKKINRLDTYLKKSCTQSG